MEQLITSMALEKEIEVNDVYKMYALHYSIVRDDYKKLLQLSPSLQKKN